MHAYTVCQNCAFVHCNRPRDEARGHSALCDNRRAMVDRYRVWLGAGVLAGGVSAAMLAGAGVAVADEASSSSTGTQASPGARSGAGASGGERHWRGRRTSHTGATDTDTKTPTSGEEPQET